ncbi:hypothetical protein D5S17_25655 [Pseudonocardiaceae bacterium YIM PH 21723]|nr:hypothetical protein D5S17_25655 [Pseudonocardiaceae bacterium YIM PH 21723]
MAGATAWLFTIILLINAQADPGSDSPEQLADQVGQALRAGDTGDLEGLLTIPEDGAQAAKATTAQFHNGQVEVTSTRVQRSGERTYVMVGYRTSDGVPGEAKLLAGHHDGRWTIDSVPSR